MTRRKLDFEAAQSHQIAVQVKDTNSSFAVNQSFTIYVTNVNEAPTSIFLSNRLIPENSPLGTVVGLINVTDPDEAFVPQNITCGLRNDAGGRFTVSGLTLRVMNSRMLNYEAPDGPDFLLDIECQDQGGETTQQQFTVELTDVNEPPVRIESSSGKFEVIIVTMVVVCKLERLNARLALRQGADLFSKISLPQGQGYAEGKYYNGSLNFLF